MKDYTVGVNELRDHYNQLRLFKKSIRAQVKMEYEAKIDFEIKSRTEAAELKFAQHLASVKERDDMPVRIIQDEVLRTRTWSIWERIRDLAGVQPEFTRAEDVREAKRLAASPFQFSADYLTLTVTKDSTGAELAEPVVYDLTTVSWANNKWWAASADNNLGLSDAERMAMRGDKKYKQYVSDEIQRQIDAGNIDNPLEKG